MRTPSSSLRPEPTSTSARHFVPLRDIVSSKLNENTFREDLTSKSRSVLPKGFYASKPISQSNGFNKVSRATPSKLSVSRIADMSSREEENIKNNNIYEKKTPVNSAGLKQSTKFPLRQVQDAGKESPAEDSKRTSYKQGLSIEQIYSKQRANMHQSYGKEPSSTVNRASSTRPEHGLPPTTKSFNGKKDLYKRETPSVHSRNANTSSRKDSSEGNRSIRGVTKENISEKSQDYGHSQTKSSILDKSANASLSSYRLSYQQGLPAKFNIPYSNKENEDRKRTEKTETNNGLKASEQKKSYGFFSFKHEDVEKKKEFAEGSRMENESHELSHNSSHHANIPTFERMHSNRAVQKSFTYGISEGGNRERRPSHTVISSNTLTCGDPKGLVGLRNIGNTCFMNSILQCLFNTPMFSDYFLHGSHQKEKNPKSKGIAEAFASLLERIRNHSGSPSHSPESTYDVKNRIAKVNSIFSGFEQHDAQELLKAVLEGINDDLSRVLTKPAYKELTIDPKKHIQETSDEWFEYMRGRDNSIVTDLFCGQLLSKTRCTACNHESLAFDNFWDLALSFTKGAKSNLADMMEQFLKEEDLDDLFHCERCKVRRYSKKKFVLWRLPKILVIQLKRFEYTKWRRDKINKSVTFPVKTFDLSQFTGESSDCSVRDAKYSLYGIVNHGGSLSGGHYTAECMNPYNKKWYNFNDSIVTESHMKKEEAESSAPYILFYVKSSCLNS